MYVNVIFNCIGWIWVIVGYTHGKCNCESICLCYHDHFENRLLLDMEDCAAAGVETRELSDT